MNLNPLVGAHPRRGRRLQCAQKELIGVGQSALQGGRLRISAKLKDAKTLRKKLQTFKTKINVASRPKASRRGARATMTMRCLKHFISRRANQDRKATNEIGRLSHIDQEIQ